MSWCKVFMSKFLCSKLKCLVQFKIKRSCFISNHDQQLTDNSMYTEIYEQPPPSKQVSFGRFGLRLDWVLDHLNRFYS